MTGGAGAAAVDGTLAVAVNGEAIAFWVLAVIALGAGMAVVAMRNVVHGALMLVTNLLAIAGLYVLLETSFLGVVQIIVYAGAIVVLFLFVIMLLGVDRDDLLIDVARGHVIGAVVLALLLATGITSAFAGAYTRAESRCGDQAAAAPAGEPSDARPCQGLGAALEESGGSVEFVGERLFTRYTFAFQLAAILLVVATIGAIVLGRRSDEPADGDPGGGAPADPGPGDLDVGAAEPAAPADPEPAASPAHGEVG